MTLFMSWKLVSVLVKISGENKLKLGFFIKIKKNGMFVVINNRFELLYLMSENFKLANQSS